MCVFPVNKIVFDLDGTLVDSAPDLHAATNHALQSIGRETVTLQQVRHMVGYGALKLIELGLEATGGMAGHTAEGLRPAFLDFYKNNVTNHTVPFDGALEVLESLNKSGFQLGLCTNKPAALTHPILENLGLKNYFGAISGGDTFEFRKPDPRHILETAALLPGDGPVLMVGDSLPDIAGARAAKAFSVVVTFGYSQTPVAELGADKVISSLRELPALVRLA